MSQETAVHWFRKGLRLHDNPALIETISEVLKRKCILRPIFILDPDIIKWMRVGSNRWRFLKQSLEQLNDNLKNINSRLYVVRGSPQVIFPILFERWNVKVLSFEFDTEPYAIKRDELIEDLASNAGVQVIQKISNTIFDVRSVIKKNNGSAPVTYQKFLSIIESLKLPNISDSPTELPDYSIPSQDCDENSDSKCYDCPSYEELGVKESDLGPCLYPGGETEALKRLESCLSQKQWICKFEKPNTAPNSLEPSTTVLSPYIKFGCLSARLFFVKLKCTIGKSPHSKPPVSLIGQLYWREFYYTAGFHTENFDKMVGNPICYQIPWEDNAEHLQAWKEGRTGYPFIDAIMRQLRQEGWIHHLARHAVACFLTRGDLWISWERGQEVFEEYLLDADWSLNAGNWMWLSASAFFHQFFRVYSPVAFGKKTDKTGSYIKKYVPELAKFPQQYIYEPWTAPLSFQKSVNCIIGTNYPNRIVIHEVIHKVNIGKMSLAYKNRSMASSVAGKKPSSDNSASNIKKKKFK